MFVHRRRIALVASILVAIVGSGCGGKGGPSTTTLAIPSKVTGPPGSEEVEVLAWDEPIAMPEKLTAVRTGADDTQLVAYYTGRPCGVDASTTSVSEDLITVQVGNVFQEDGCQSVEDCLEALAPNTDPIQSHGWGGECTRDRAHGIQLPGSVNGRKVYDGHTRHEVIDGGQLANARFPGTPRAQSDWLVAGHMGGEMSSDHFTWVSRGPDHSLVQERPVGKTGSGWRAHCAVSDPELRREIVDINGSTADYVECQGSGATITWQHDNDGIMLYAFPREATGDRLYSETIDVARSVSFGGSS